MKMYFPESKGTIDYVGYNHAVALFNKALAEYIVDDPKEADCRIYCNLPWHHNPKELKSVGLPLVAYTMYESDKVPSAWVKFLNKHIDAIMVPSEFCKNVFKASGVRKPIWILSLGYDPDEFCLAPKDEGNPFYTFLWQGVAYDKGGRKGVDIVEDAFKELKHEGRLGGECRLIIKTLPSRDKPLEMKKVITADDIIFIQEKMPRIKLNELYSVVDCCINPTHGEGFGLIPLEQMALGKPVIVTDWSIPYLQKGHYIPLEYELKTSPVSWNHNHFTIGIKGIHYNTGGLTSEIELSKVPLPRPDGRGQPGVIPGLEVVNKGLRPLPFGVKYWNRFRNMLDRWQIGLDKKIQKQLQIFII